VRAIHMNYAPTPAELQALKDSPHVSVDDQADLELYYEANALERGKPAVVLKGIILETGQVVLMRISVKMLLTLAAGVQGRAQHDGLMDYVPLRPGDLKDG